MWQDLTEVYSHPDGHNLERMATLVQNGSPIRQDLDILLRSPKKNFVRFKCWLKRGGAITRKACGITGRIVWIFAQPEGKSRFRLALLLTERMPALQFPK